MIGAMLRGPFSDRSVGPKYTNSLHKGLTSTRWPSRNYRPWPPSAIISLYCCGTHKGKPVPYEMKELVLIVAPEVDSFKWYTTQRNYFDNQVLFRGPRAVRTMFAADLHSFTSCLGERHATLKPIGLYDKTLEQYQRAAHFGFYVCKISETRGSEPIMIA